MNVGDWRVRLEESYQLFTNDLAELITRDAVPITEAKVPTAVGVYLFEFDDDVTYVGEAKGSGGLHDRICRKHVSGDESHAVQRFFMREFPDRTARREFILLNVHVKWVVIEDIERIAIIERLAIWLFQPKWNVL